MSSTNLPPVDWTEVKGVSSHQRMAALDLAAPLLEMGNLNPIIPIDGGPTFIDFVRWEGDLIAHSAIFADQSDKRGNAYMPDVPIPYGETIRLCVYQEFGASPEIQPQVYALIHSFTPADHALLLTALLGRRDKRRPGGLGERLIGNAGYFPEILGWDDLSKGMAERAGPGFDRRHFVRSIYIEDVDSELGAEVHTVMTFESLRPSLLGLLRRA